MRSPLLSRPFGREIKYFWVFIFCARAEKTKYFLFFTFFYFFQKITKIFFWKKFDRVFTYVYFLWFFLSTLARVFCAHFFQKCSEITFPASEPSVLFCSEKYKTKIFFAFLHFLKFIFIFFKSALYFDAGCESN